MTSPPVLEYGDEFSRRGITCRTTNDGIHLTIPNVPGTARLVQVPRRLWPLFFGVEVVVNFPLLVVGLIGGGFAWFRLFKSRPLVEAEVTRDELIVTDRRESELLPVRHRWPRYEIAEFRPSRYGDSIWVRIPGREMATILQAVDRPALEYVSRHVVPLLRLGKAGA